MTPTAEHTLKRPPTQFQKPNTFSGKIPNAAAFSTSELSAMMCWRVTFSWGMEGIPRNSQSRIVRALSMVSAVVKLFDTTITSVSSGSRPSVARATSTGSTLARNLRVRPFAATLHSGSQRSASYTNSGPRYEPPMPMLITLTSFLPVAPCHAPLRTRSAKSLILSSTSFTCWTASAPSTMIGAWSLGARSAMCMTARSSVALMCSPERIWRRFCGTPAASASATSLSMVSGSIFCRL
mmetsp:Transcript_5622/g.22110  ORF Transcript_5622/g.22110 Transcript_5622/m.22110 type:complete len:238 (-) Transcript_5622:230-943(-)